jgi:hypothetical protein
MVQVSSSKKKASFWETPIPGLNITAAIVLWLVATTIAPLLFVKSLPNPLGLALLFVNNLNILIAFCEMA